MKASTLQSFAHSNSSSNDGAWKILNSIANSTGDDHAKGKEDVLNFVVAIGLRHAITCHCDKSDSVTRDVRRMLSQLNEEYPFDVSEANTRVSNLFNKYINLTVGINSYTEIMLLMDTLNNMSDGNESELPKPTPEQEHAWNYLY